MKLRDRLEPYTMSNDAHEERIARAYHVPYWRTSSRPKPSWRRRPGWRLRAIWWRIFG